MFNARRDHNVNDQFSQRADPKITIDVSASVGGESPLGSPNTGIGGDDSDDARLRRRARSVAQMMTSGRLSSMMEHRDALQLFIGGYSEDFANERTVLHTKILPQVCRWCLEAGVEFDAVDLMHCTNHLLPPGPADGAVCKREAAESLGKSTVGLRYISLVGNKVGPQPLPEKISKRVFQELVHHASSEADAQLVRDWYVADPLAFPAQYMLLSPLYAAQEMQNGADLDDLSPEDKLDAAQRYVAVDKGLRRIVQTALAAHYPHLLPHSLLEVELNVFLAGAQGKATPAASGAASPVKGRAAERSQTGKNIMILRSVRGIDKSDSKARSYLDLSPEGNADKEASSFIDWIHNTGVQQYLGSDKGVFKATVNWHSSGMPVYL
jgi:hypothetical protein